MRIYRFIFHVFLVFLLFGFLRSIDYLSPKLIINVSSDVKGISQVFYNFEGYSEPNSSVNNIEKGDNELIFFLKEGSSPLRWDPLASSGNVVVKSLIVKIGWLDFFIPLDHLTVLQQVKKIRDGDELRLSVQNSLNDPQLLLDYNPSRVLVYYNMILAALSLVLVLAVGVFSRYKKNFLNRLVSVDEKIKHAVFSCIYIKGFWERLLILFCISLVSNIYFVSNLSLSIDDEYAALREDPSVWIGQGRWFVFLIEKYLFLQPAIPFSPYILFSFSLAFSYIFILKAHGLRFNWIVYFCYPLFCAFPTWWFIEEFSANIPSLGFGLMFVSVAAFIHMRRLGESKFIVWRELLLTILLVSFAIAAYQSLLIVFVSMCFGAFLIRSSFSGLIISKIFKLMLCRVIYLSFSVFASLLMYWLINTFFQSYYEARSSYLNEFVDVELLVKKPLLVFHNIIHELWLIYSGSSLRYGSEMSFAGVLLLFSIFSLFLKVNINKSISLVLLGVVILLPFLLHVLSGGAPLPIRTMVVLAYTTWLMSILAVSNGYFLIKSVSVFVVIIYQIQVFNVNSEYIASATITQQHDRFLAADIYRRIGEVSSNFNPDEVIKIDVFGSKQINTPYANGWSSTMQASFFGWDSGNLVRMMKYMHVLGYKNLTMPTDEERKAMTSYFQNMPVWPALGAVQKVNDIYLVKIGKIADPAHNESM